MADRETSGLPVHDPFGQAPPEYQLDGPVFPWNSTTNYGEGNLTELDGIYYASLQNNTNVEPGTDPATWAVVGSGATGGGGSGLPEDGTEGDIVVNTAPGEGEWQSLDEAGIASLADLGDEESARVAADADLADDIAAEATARAAADTAHATALDPHPQYETSAEAQAKADAAQAAAAADATTKANTAEANAATYTDTVASTKADLVGGFVPTSQIPAIAISEFLGTIGSQAAMLNLSGERGDWCNRSDLGKTAIITGDDPALLSDWTFVTYPASPITSVNGQVGVVNLAASDVGAQPVDSDLTAIAALSTTGFGRDMLTRADAAAARSYFGLGSAALSAATDFQPVDSDLTAIAALSTTGFGRGFLDLADAAAGRTKLGLGGAAVLNLGTTAGTVSEGDHTHSASVAGIVGTRTTAAVPSSGTGADGDWNLLLGALGNFAGELKDGRLAFKRSGAWSNAFNTEGSRVNLPIRTVSEQPGIIPGALITYATSWVATPPADVDSSGMQVVSSSFAAAASGTYGWLTVDENAAANSSTSGLSFFSFGCQITALPESGKFLEIGQLVGSSFGGYGLFVRIDSSGQFWIVDGQGGSPDVTISDVGTGVAANAYITVERFGNRMTAYRTGASDKKFNTKVDAYVGSPSFYSGIYGKAAWGICTNASSVRVSGTAAKVYV